MEDFVPAVFRRVVCVPDEFAGPPSAVAATRVAHQSAPLQRRLVRAVPPYHRCRAVAEWASRYWRTNAPNAFSSFNVTGPGAEAIL